MVICFVRLTSSSDSFRARFTRSANSSFGDQPLMRGSPSRCERPDALLINSRSSRLGSSLPSNSFFILFSDSLKALSISFLPRLEARSYFVGADSGILLSIFLISARAGDPAVAVVIPTLAVDSTPSAVPLPSNLPTPLAVPPNMARGTSSSISIGFSACSPARIAPVATGVALPSLRDSLSPPLNTCIPDLTALAEGRAK